MYTRRAFSGFQKAVIVFVLCGALAGGVALLQTFAGTKIADTLNIAASAGSLNYGLVGHWTFDGPDMPSGQVNDVSGSGAHGSQMAMSTSTAYVKGVLGQALGFDGNNDVVIVGYNASLNVTNDITISAWIKKNRNSTQGDIFTKGPNDNSAWDYGYYLNTSNLMRFASDTIGGGVNSNTTITDFAWHHVAVTRSGSTVTHYIDGVARGSGTLSGSFGSGSNPLHIGKGGDLSNGATFPGTVDDVRVYNRALSEDEIRQLYQLGATTKIATTPSQSASGTGLNYGLVGHWTFDGKDMPSGQVNDVSALANHGSMTNMATTTSRARGVVGQGLFFDGSDDFIDMPVSSSLNMSSGVTLSAWINATSTAGAGARRIITLPYGEVAGSEKYAILLRNNQIEFFLQAQADDNIVAAYTHRNSWHHVAATYSNTNGLMTIYIDGVLATSDTHATGGDIIQNSSGNFQLGRFGPTWGQFFGGMMDDARVYNRALSDDEIKQLYQLGATTKVATTPTASSQQNTGVNYGLVGHWTFDGKDVVTGQVNDVSGQGNHGSQRSMSTSSAYVKGVLGQALSFDGADDVVTGGALTGQVAARTNCAWIKPRTSSGLKGITRLNGSWHFRVNSMKLEARAYDSIAAPSNSYSSTATLAPNVWYHVCEVVDAPDAGPIDLYFYINGSLDSFRETNINGPNTGSDAVKDIAIGNDPDAAGRFFPGEMDDVRMYNRALSADEIRQLYQMGQ